MSKSLQSHFLCFAPLSSQTSQDWRIHEGCKVSFSLCNPILVSIVSMSCFVLRNPSISAFCPTNCLCRSSAKAAAATAAVFQQAAVFDFPPTLLAGRSKAASSVKLPCQDTHQTQLLYREDLNYRFLKLQT